MLLPHFLGHLNSESGLCGKQQSLALGSTCSESYGGTHFDHLTHALRVRPIVSSIWKRQKPTRSEEHTSELQSPCNLVCRLLLEKKKTNKRNVRRMHDARTTAHRCT